MHLSLNAQFHPNDFYQTFFSLQSKNHIWNKPGVDSIEIFLSFSSLYNFVERRLLFFYLQKSQNGGTGNHWLKSIKKKSVRIFRAFFNKYRNSSSWRIL
jgi:hypothetical protein